MTEMVSLPLRLHPLLIYPVFRKIMSHLPLSDILSVRQVCTEWMIEADHKLQDKVVVKIAFLHKLQQFVNEIPQEGIKITSHYQIELLNLNSIEAVNFFNKFGAHIKSLSLRFCDWKSATLRTALFKKMPNLVSLEVSSSKNCGHWLEPLMPMSCLPYGSFVHLNHLRELRIIGDFSNRTDLFYDILKSSSNLEIIHLSKYHPDNDDLFGTWLVEIILSCDFLHLSTLQVECTLIQQQIDSLMEKSYALRRLSIDLEIDAVYNESIDKIVRHFPLLESVEFGVDNVTPSLTQSIILQLKNIQCWIAVHNGTRIMFLPKQNMLVPFEL